MTDRINQTPPAGLIKGEDGLLRCDWHGNYTGYDWYHDEEWGCPVKDDQRLFEKICLEGFQSGLSWLTVLKKRGNFRRAFHNFHIDTVARMSQKDVDTLLLDAGLIRHRKKIESTINNAQRALEMQSEFGTLAHWFWSFEAAAQAERPSNPSAEDVFSFTKTETSTQISKDLKRRGWSFVGPTTVYAFMQAMGLVNDHIPGCHRRFACQHKRDSFILP